jgi:hypothetical protein
LTLALSLGAIEDEASEPKSSAFNVHVYTARIVTSILTLESRHEKAFNARESQRRSFIYRIACIFAAFAKVETKTLFVDITRDARISIAHCSSALFSLASPGLISRSVPFCAPFVVCNVISAINIQYLLISLFAQVAALSSSFFVDLFSM